MTNSKDGWLLLMMLILFLVSTEPEPATATSLKTNKNQVTDFFNKEIEDSKGLETNLEHSKQQAISTIGSKEAIEALGTNENELASKTAELGSIDEQDLAAKGRLERAKPENQYYERLELDYSDPQILNDKKDIDLIASSSEKLISKLIDGFRDFGVDCQNVEGNTAVTIEHFITVGKQPQKDTTYQQKICEQLRSNYHCQDVLTLKCLEFGEEATPIRVSNVAASGYGRNNGTGQFVRNPQVNWQQVGQYINIASTVGDIRGWHHNPDGPFWSAALDIQIDIELLDELKRLHSLLIENLNFAGNILISVNGQVIINHPAGGNILNPTGQLQWLRSGNGEQGFEQVELDSGRSFVVWWDQDDSGRHGGPSHRVLSNIDLKPFIKQGSNVINIKQVGCIHNSLNMRLKASRLACSRWHEEWNEQCQLN